MMPFSEKLSFLMHITKSSNKELAAELSVDPSMVSLMRTGRRKLSRNPAQVKKMSMFFARHCSAAFQRQALSEMLDQVSISPSMPTETLASCLETWLQGERPIADTFLSGIQKASTLEREAAADPSPAVRLPASDAQTLFFYGEEGRQEAMYRVMQEIRNLEKPGSILTVVDDNLEWLLPNYPLTKKIQTWLLESAERGFTFLQIMPPLNYINRYTESLQFWLPMYASGQTKVYYYPRLRGNLYRHSIIVVPGCCVQYASAVATGSTSDITMFSTDLKLVSAFEKQFYEHLSLCRPALSAYHGVPDFLRCCSKFFSSESDAIQAVNCLSLASMPLELLEDCARDAVRPGWAQIFQMHRDEQARFEQKLLDRTFIDMCRLATAEEVRAGSVPIAAPIRTHLKQGFYTPETYCMHLRNILRLMDRYENYTFFPLRDNERQNFDLFVSEGEMAQIVQTTEPMSIIEVCRPQMVIAFWEFLLRRAETVGYEGIHREKIRMELRGLIQALGG